MDNFGSIDLSWIDVAKGGLVDVLSMGDAFLSHPDTMNEKNRKYWCNIHILPVMPEFMIDMRAHNKVACWALAKTLGSAEDPIKQGMAILLTTFPGGLWDMTIGIVKLVIHPDQVLMPVTEAVQIIRLHFSNDEWEPYFVLTLLHTSCIELLPLGIMHGDGVTAVGVAALVMNLQDNTLDLTKSEGTITTLLTHRLLCGPTREIPRDMALILPLLSLSPWTGIRKLGVGYMPVHPFMTAYHPSLVQGLTSKDDKMQ